MNRFYLIPAVTAILGDGTTTTYPKYIKSFRNPTGFPCRFSASRYGRQDMWLNRVMEISDTDAQSLSAFSDVYTFPEDSGIDAAISDKQVIDTFFEGFNIPTDWTTPSTTYRELLRSLANMASFLQRYFGIAGEELFLEGVTLDSRVRDLSALAQTTLQATVLSFGYDIPINQNSTLRQLLKIAADTLQSTPIHLGDITL